MTPLDVPHQVVLITGPTFPGDLSHLEHGHSPSWAIVTIKLLLCREVVLARLAFMGTWGKRLLTVVLEATAFLELLRGGNRQGACTPPAHCSTIAQRKYPS